MHIPDGFINNNITGPALGSAVAFVSLAFRQVYHRISKRVAMAQKQTATVPQIDSPETSSRVSLTTSGQQLLQRMLIVAGLIFMLQLMNVPLVAGIPGHLLGGALAAFILGPWAAMVTLAIVLMLQAVGMNDGGIGALGINFLTMGIISVWSAWGLAHIAKKKTPLLLGLSALLSVVITALTTAAFLNFNTGIFGGAVQPFMLTHGIVGVAEALLTVALIVALKNRWSPIAILAADIPDKK